MNTLKELWHNLSHSWLVEKNLTQVTENEVAIESMYSLVSLGTERTITTQLLTKEIAARMVVPYMRGTFQNEFTYGYSLVGRIIDGEKDLIGKVIHVMHPHQNYAVVKTQDIFFIPEQMNPKLATLVSNMETAVNAIWDANVEIGDKVLVIGYGTVGALTALIASKIPGIDISILEINQNRFNAAVEQGFKVSSILENKDFDIVFNTSGNAEMLQKAISVTKSEGRIIEMSWYGAKSITINFGADFHYGRKQLISSQVSQIPNRKLKNWTYHSRKKLVFKLLQELNPHYLINCEVHFSETPKFYNDLRRHETSGLGVVIKY
ncbi:MAG: zinc-binding alcohol dehydrogenase [Bacteroidota bacterium]